MANSMGKQLKLGKYELFLPSRYQSYTSIQLKFTSHEISSTSFVLSDSHLVCFQWFDIVTVRIMLCVSRLSKLTI